MKYSTKMKIYIIHSIGFIDISQMSWKSWVIYWRVATLFIASLPVCWLSDASRGCQLPDVRMKSTLCVV